MATLRANHTDAIKRPTAQRADVLPELATRAGAIRTLEAVHLDGQHDPSLEHRPLLEAAHIAAMSPAAPAPADRARCIAHRTAGLDQDRLASLFGVDDALAYKGKDLGDPAERLVHDFAATGAPPAGKRGPMRAVKLFAEGPEAALTLPVAETKRFARSLHADLPAV